MLEKKHPNDHVVLISRNFYVRIVAQACGLETQDYKHDRIKSLDPGIALIALKNDGEALFRRLYTPPAYAVDASLVLRAAGLEKVSLLSNQFCKLTRHSPEKNCERKAYAVFKAGDPSQFRLVEDFKETKTRKVAPRNLEQRLFFKALLDPLIRFVAASGPAGTGKTLFPLQAAYEMWHADLFDQILVFRPRSEVGDPMGALPGNVRKKIEPWMTPIFRALRKVVPPTTEHDTAILSGVVVSKVIETLVVEGVIQILPTAYVQGDTFERSFILIDEAQNMTSDEMESLLTRLGEGSKMVINGDVGQVRNPKIKQLLSGFVRAVECLRGRDVFSYVTLWKCERDPAVQIIIDNY